MKIDSALREIEETREHLNMLERWLKTNAEKFEHSSVGNRITTSLNLSPTQVFVYAGEGPREFAKQFGGSCTVRQDAWEMHFKGFQITMMEAAEKKEVVL